MYLYVYIYIHKKYIYIFILYLIWKHSIFSEIYTCMCVYLYIHNKYVQYTQILCKQTFILDAINRLRALTYICTLTGHFIRYTLLEPGWTPFCLQNCLNSLWHRFNKVLEIFLRDFVPYWHDSITQLLQFCRLHIHDENLPFHHIPKVLYWIEIWWLWRPFE